MRVRFLPSFLLLLCATTLAASEFDIPHAAHFYMSRRGQELLKDHLQRIVEINGVDLEHGRLREFPYIAAKPLTLSSLPGSHKEFSNLLKTMRDGLKEWLVGFEFNDPLLKAKINNSGFDSKLGYLGLEADLMLTQSLGAAKGVAFNLRAEFPEIKIFAENAIGWDRNNSFLGAFGIYGPWIRYSNSTKPLVVQVPFRIDIQPDGKIEAEALNAYTNLTGLALESGFSWLLLPQVKFKVNDEVMTFNTDELLKLIRANQPALTRMLQRNVQNFVEEEMPKRLSEMLVKPLARSFDNVRSINPPGIEVGKGAPPFKWALSPRDLKMDDEFLDVRLDGYVQDPSSADSGLKPIPDRQLPEPRTVEPSAFDLLLALKIDVVNRIVERSCKRGYLDTVQVEADDQPDPGVIKMETLKLASCPIFTTDAPREDFASLHVDVKLPTKGVVQTAVLQDPYQASADLDVRFLVKPHAFDIQLVRIRSATIEDRYLRYPSLRERVEKAKGELVAKKNARYARRVSLLAENVKLPDELFGIPIVLDRIQLDPKGYLKLYLRYDWAEFRRKGILQ